MSDIGHTLWRCRRGSRELDELLERYVRRHYPGAGSIERAAFKRILDLPDPVLTDYLFGYVEPADPETVRLVERIAGHYG